MNRERSGFRRTCRDCREDGSDTFLFLLLSFFLFLTISLDSELGDEISFKLIERPTLEFLYASLYLLCRKKICTSVSLYARARVYSDIIFCKHLFNTGSNGCLLCSIIVQ